MQMQKRKKMKNNTKKATEAKNGTQALIKRSEVCLYPQK